MKYLKPYNESIKDFLKPKPEDDIIKSVENLPMKDRLIKGLLYNIKWLVDDVKNKIGDGYLEISRNDYFANDETIWWLSSVSSSGTFIKNSSMSTWTRGTSGIPTNWTVQNATS